MNTFKRKLIGLFKENMQLRQDYLKRSLNWTEENEIGEMLILIFLKMADILKKIYQANQLSDQTRMEKSGPREELRQFKNSLLPHQVTAIIDDHACNPLT